MKGKRYSTIAAGIAAMGLILSACGGDEGGTTDGGAAAACSAGKLSGYALGPSGPVDISDAQPVAKSVRAQAKPTVKIGMFGDLTGAVSGLVTPIRDAAQLAIEQRNAAGDLQVNVTFVAKDNKDADPTTAPPIEQSFIDDPEVVGVIGGAFSGETLVVGEKMDQAGLTHISASATDPTITDHGWPFFRAVVTDDIQGPKMARLLDAIGCTKIAVVDDTGDYGKGLANFVAKELRNLGVEIAVRRSISDKTQDYSPLVDTISNKDVDAVFYGGYYSAASALLKQMREAGVEALFSCGDGCADKQFVSLAGADNAGGAVVTCPCVIPALAPDDPKAAALQTAYKAKYNKDALVYSAEATDAANIFLDAIAASDDDGKVTRQEVLRFVRDLEGYEGVSRTYTFGEDGELEQSAQVINVYPVGSDGEISLLGKVEDVIPAA